jgi:class 3 adenylate cyclase
MAIRPLSQLARRLYREPGETSRETRARENLSQVLVYFSVVLVTALFFFDILSGEAARWGHAYPSVPLARANWKLLVNPPSAAGCEQTGVVARDCPAHPGNPALWRDGEDRFDAHGSRKRKAKKDFWIGATFSPEMTAKAYALRANQLILGWVYSDYELFVNGEWVAHGRIDERQAAVLPVPLTQLASSPSLRVALLIHPDSEGGAPDYLASPWQEGLATAEEASAYRSANVFLMSAKPFALFLVNFLFSALFFLFWQLQKKKQEYFYLALYGAIGAMVQLKAMDIFRGALDITSTHAFELFLYSAEGGFGLLTALSFSRGRRSLFRHAVPLLLIAPWALMLAPIGASGRSHLIAFIKSWYLPGCYVAGAVACFAQAYHLSETPETSRLKARIRQLLFFGGGMALMGAITFAEMHGMFSLVAVAFTSRFTHFSVVLLLSAIALREYREERRLLERSPISKYHRLAELPACLRGALLCVDIKGSEYLSQQSANATGDSGRLVRTCLSHLWGAVLAEKGTVLSTEGDGLHAFFDKGDCANPAASALRAADRMRERLAELGRQLHAQGLHQGRDLAFRAGLATGEIKPVWQEVDRVRVAGWSDTGAGKVFVESARLMEIERQAGGAAEGSFVVVAAETAFALRTLPGLTGRWSLESKNFVGKHGRSYLVSVYSPGGEHEASEDEICVAG